MMRAVAIKNEKGPADSLFITEIPLPKISDTDVLVKVKAFGLNRMDLSQREGKYPVPPQAPKTLGVEFSGIIEELGSSVADFKKGDEVLGLAYGGAYAEYIAVSRNMLVHKPAHITWEEAAGIPETWITALQAIFAVGEFTKGKTILWHAGASSVSIAGIQLSKVEGAAAIYATAGSDEKIKLCKELGATDGFNYKTQDWSAEVLKATDGKGVDLIIDFIGASYFQGNLNAAARDGRIVQLANMGGSELPAGINISQILYKRLRLEGSTLRSRDPEYQRKLRDLLADHVLPKFEDGTFQIKVEKVFPWTEIVEAHKLMESNVSKGKIICKIE